jgi:hypothetical protein
MKVAMLPIIRRQFLAREMSTFSRSGAFMKPISPLLLLRVSEAMTMSLSSPW